MHARLFRMEKGKLKKKEQMYQNDKFVLSILIYFSSNIAMYARITLFPILWLSLHRCLLLLNSLWFLLISYQYTLATPLKIPKSVIFRYWCSYLFPFTTTIGKHAILLYAISLPLLYSWGLAQCWEICGQSMFYFWPVTYFVFWKPKVLPLISSLLFYLHVIAPFISSSFSDSSFSNCMSNFALELASQSSVLFHFLKDMNSSWIFIFY